MKTRIYEKTEVTKSLSGKPECDFCSGNELKYMHYVEPFMIEDMPTPKDDYYDDGKWAACEKCHQLIEAHDKRGLAEWSMLIFIRRFHVPPTANMLKALTAIHEGFWRGYKGRFEKI